MKISDDCVCGDEIVLFTEKPERALDILHTWQGWHEDCDGPIMKYGEEDDEFPRVYDDAAFVSEQALLGALMLDKSAHERLPDTLECRHFITSKHALIFEVIKELIGEGKRYDPVKVADCLGSDLEECGGLPYLAHLVLTTPGSDHIERYAEIVIENWSFYGRAG